MTGQGKRNVLRLPARIGSRGGAAKRPCLGGCGQAPHPTRVRLRCTVPGQSARSLEHVPGLLAGNRRVQLKLVGGIWVLAMAQRLFVVTSRVAIRRLLYLSGLTRAQSG